MRQSIGNTLLLLILVNTFGYGLLDWAHTLLHYLPTQTDENALYYFHVHDDDTDHTHTLADHHHFFDESNDPNEGRNIALLLLDFLNFPLIKPDLNLLPILCAATPGAHPVWDAYPPDDCLTRLIAPPPETLVS